MNLLRFGMLGAVAVSSSAYAADLPTQKPAPMPPPLPLPYNWTGLYVGGYAGGSFGAAGLSDIPVPTFSGGNTLALSGFTGGGLVGYNYQIGPAVVGAEGEFGYDGRSGSTNYLNAAGASVSEKFDGSYIGRVRARAGYAMNNILIYAAGGVSFADGQVKLSMPGLSQSITKEFTGYNVGGGVEYAFTPNWIGRVEYIYDGFGSATYGFGAAPTTFDSRKVSFHENTVRAAVEYKF